MNVEWVRLGDVLELQREPVEITDGHHYRKVGIYSWGRGMIHYRATPAAEMGSLRYFRFPPGALMLSNIQAWEQAVAITSIAEATDYVCSNRFLPYVPLSDAVHVPYVAHYLLSEAGHQLLKRASPGTQVRNRTLGKGLFERERVPLPAIDDQRRIAAHLDRLTGPPLSDVTSAVSDVLEVALSADEWQGQLGDLLEPDLDEVPVVPTEVYRAMGVFGHGRGAIDRGAFQGADTSYRSMLRVKRGQVVFSRLKAFEGAVTMIPRHLDGALVSKEFPVLSVLPDVDSHFVSGLIRSTRMREAMRSASVGIGARRERLSLASFLSLPAPAPSVSRQEEIGRLVTLLDSVTTLAHRRRDLRQALLPAARNEIFSSMR